MNAPGQAPHEPKRPETIGDQGATPIRRIEAPALKPMVNKASGSQPPFLERRRQTKGSQACASAPAPKTIIPGLSPKHYGILLGAAGVAAVLFLFFTMGQSKPVQISNLEQATGPMATPEPEATEEAPIMAKTPAEWVDLARISAVRKTKLIVNGSIYSINEPIPPFDLRWVGKRETELIFKDPAGHEYRRRYATSINNDPVAPAPEMENTLPPP